MSLINNMLKDLEKRKHHTQPTPYLAVTNQHPRKKFIINEKIIFSALLILVIITSLLLVMRSHRAHSPVIEMLPAQANSPASISVPEETSAWVKPVTINGMTLQVKENITELTVLLDHPALYRLTTDNMQNQISIMIDHAELRSELPSNTVNSAIEHLSSQNINDDVKINLTLYPGTVVKYVNLNSDSKNPELVIAIESNNPKSSHASTTNLIKTPAIRDLLNKQYQNALSAAASGHYQKAIDDLNAIIKMDPEFIDARVSLIALLINQKNSIKAAQLLNDGLSLSPNNLALIELKARLLTTDGRVKEALMLLQSSPPDIEDNPDYHAFMAALQERTNHDAVAVEIYKKLININSHNGNWWFGLGVSLDKLGRTKQAADAYTAAVSEGHLDSASLVYLQKRLQALQELHDEKG